MGYTIFGKVDTLEEFEELRKKDNKEKMKNKIKLRRWLLDLLYEEHVQCDSGIESLVDDIEQIIEDCLIDD